MPSTETKPELTAKASMAQPVSQPAVYANGLTHTHKKQLTLSQIIFELDYIVQAVHARAVQKNSHNTTNKCTKIKITLFFFTQFFTTLKFFHLS
jgi:hypothetical protein